MVTTEEPKTPANDNLFFEDAPVGVFKVYIALSRHEVAMIDIFHLK